MADTTEYALLLPGDESVWANADEETRRTVYARHDHFMQLLRERGHEVTGGAELALSSGAKVVRGSLDDVSVTDGPFAETAEQLTGFYMVRTADLDDLLRVCGLLSETGPGVEVRAVVPPSEEASGIVGETAAVRG